MIVILCPIIEVINTIKLKCALRETSKKIKQNAEENYNTIPRHNYNSEL